MKRLAVLLALLCPLVYCASDAGGSVLVIPDTTLSSASNYNNFGTHPFLHHIRGGTPVFFTLTQDYEVTDLIAVRATGQVDLNTTTHGPFVTNAAGIIIARNPSYYTQPIGGFLFYPETDSGVPLYPDPDGVPYRYGSVLIGIGGTTDYYELFPADASTGLGSATPPTDISTTRTLGDVFGHALPAGTQLGLTIFETYASDNAGTFELTPIPEPSTLIIWSLLASLGMGLGWWRRRKRAA